MGRLIGIQFGFLWLSEDQKNGNKTHLGNNIHSRLNGMSFNSATTSILYRVGQKNCTWLSLQ